MTLYTEVAVHSSESNSARLYVRIDFMYVTIDEYKNKYRNKVAEVNLPLASRFDLTITSWG